jgi:oligopeptide transport system substrate-binding protein
VHATGNGSIGVQVLDDRTLRVTLQHPVPWFDELVAFPVAAPVPTRPNVFSGPFRVVSRAGGKLALERNFNYWNADAVKPSRLVLSTATKGADAVLPRQLAGPGLPWIDTAGPAPPDADELPLLATGQVWFDTRRPPLNDLGTRQYVAFVITHVNLGTDPVSFVPPAMPGASIVNSHARVKAQSNPRPVRLSVAWAQQDVAASRLADVLRRRSDVLRRFGLTLSFQPVPGVADLEAQDADLTLLGWSSKVFDPYNQLDQFTCGSAFNVARWCNPSYDALMRQAVRTLDDNDRWQIERRLVEKLHDGVPAIPVYFGGDSFSLAPGVHGFSWSPIGLYELMGMTRS